MSLIFFQIVQNLMHIPKMKENSSKIPLVFQICAFELVAENFPYYDENTHHW